MEIALSSAVKAGKEKLRKIGIMITCCYLGTFSSYCDTKLNNSGDIFSVAEGAVDSVQDKLVSLGTKLFPLALVICIVSLFITHDERKLQIELKILITLCVCYALLLLIDNGTFVTTVKSILGL